MRLRLRAKGLVPAKVAAKVWDLPGPHIDVDSDAKRFALEAGIAEVDVIYPATTHMRLEVKGTP